MKFVGYLLSELAKTLLVMISLPITIPALIAFAIYEDYARERRMNYEKARRMNGGME